jgi:hypothetical protein
MGQWNNQDGLPLQFGTTKALPDWSGDYVAYGSTRIAECLIPLVPVTMGGYTMPAIPTSFSGTTTYAAAGISNPDFLFPLQTTAPQTASGSAITISKPQLIIEKVEVSSLSPMAGGTSVTVGLAVMNASQNFVQVTDAVSSGGNHLVDTLATATLNTSGGTAIWYAATNTRSFPASTAGGGAWVGIRAPLITNSITPLPQGAWVSAIATGSFTDGVLQMKVYYKYSGSINQ